MCNLCLTKSVYEFTNKRTLCKTCYLRWFEKKFLYAVRRFEMIKRGDVLSYKKRNNFRDVVLEEVLNLFNRKSGIEIKSKGNKIAVSDTTDVIAERIIKDLIEGKANFKNVKPVDGKVVHPLCLFLDKEVLLYAKLKKLKCKRILEKKNKISNFINELEKKHPEVKRAIVNSYLEL